MLAIVQLSSVKMKEGDLEVGTGTETVSSVTFLRILMRHPITQLSFSRMKVEAAAGSGG